MSNTPEQLELLGLCKKCLFTGQRASRPYGALAVSESSSSGAGKKDGADDAHVVTKGEEEQGARAGKGKGKGKEKEKEKGTWRSDVERGGEWEEWVVTEGVEEKWVGLTWEWGYVCEDEERDLWFMKLVEMGLVRWGGKGGDGGDGDGEGERGEKEEEEDEDEEEADRYDAEGKDSTEDDSDENGDVLDRQGKAVVHASPKGHPCGPSESPAESPEMETNIETEYDSVAARKIAWRAKQKALTQAGDDEAESASRELVSQKEAMAAMEDGALGHGEQTKLVFRGGKES
jgi:hypothetical protein